MFNSLWSTWKFNSLTRTIKSIWCYISWSAITYDRNVSYNFRMSRILLVFSIYFLIGLPYVQLIVCPKNICQTTQCKEVHCQENEVFVKNGGFCACCDTCYKILGKYVNIFYVYSNSVKTSICFMMLEQVQILYLLYCIT